MPYTTNVAGTTITAAWANANVRDQVVTPFASASARSSAITSPIQGMVSARADENVIEFYDGAAWVPVGWKPIATTTLTGTAASVSFTSIPATYKNLKVVILARGDAVAVAIDVLLRMNNDTSTNYSYTSWILNQGDTGVTVSTANGATSLQASRIPAASFGTSSSFGGGIVEILGYSNASVATKQIFGWASVSDYGNAGQTRIRMGAWGVNGGGGVAVNRLDLIAGSGNFVAGSRFDVYGLGA